MRLEHLLSGEMIPKERLWLKSEGVIDKKKGVETQPETKVEQYRRVILNFTYTTGLCFKRYIQPEQQTFREARLRIKN